MRKSIPNFKQIEGLRLNHLDDLNDPICQSQSIIRTATPTKNMQKSVILKL